MHATSMYLHLLVLIGNTPSRPPEEVRVPQSASASGAGVCEFCTVLAHSAEYGNEVHVQSGVWQNWKDFDDRFEYYLFRVKLFHYAICIRRRDTNATLTIDLVVNNKAGSRADSKWYIRVREAEWRPGNRNISTSKHKWHAAAALKAVHEFSPKFGDWTAIANNCSTWVKGVVGFMGDDNRRSLCDCDPITDDFDRLRSFGDSIGVELTYLSRREAREILPQPELENDEEDLMVAAGEGATNTTEVQGEGGEERGSGGNIEELNNKE